MPKQEAIRKIVLSFQCNGFFIKNYHENKNMSDESSMWLPLGKNMVWELN